MRIHNCPARRARSFLAVVAVLLTACDDFPSDFEEEDVPPAEIIDLSRARAPEPLRADGTTTDTLVARIPEDARVRLITFRTTGGLFERSGTKELTLRAEPPDSGSVDKRLQAEAVLRTDTIAARVFVTATVESFSDTVEVVFAPRS